MGNAKRRKENREFIGGKKNFRKFSGNDEKVPDQPQVMELKMSEDLIKKARMIRDNVQSLSSQGFWIREKLYNELNVIRERINKLKIEHQKEMDFFLRSKKQKGRKIVEINLDKGVVKIFK